MLLWHVVKIEFKPSTSEEERAGCEQMILDHLEADDGVIFRRLGRCTRTPANTLVMSGFASQEALDAYYAAPSHAEVHAEVNRLKQGGRAAIDVWTDDPVDVLPRIG